MDLLSELRNILPDEKSVSADGEEVERHGGGMFTYHDPCPPDAVVYPRDRDEVAKVLRFASEHGVPVVPFGQGSSLEGQTIPKEGGISARLRGRGLFSRSTPAGMPPSVGWLPPTRAGRTPCATGRCGTKSLGLRWGSQAAP
jgi:hypothetical protein